MQYQGGISSPLEIPVADAAPALFTIAALGSGPGAILNQDFTLSSADNPAAKGSVVMLYATGEGQTEPPGSDGQVAEGASWVPELPVQVLIGGVDAQVEYAGAAPGLVAGVLQVNARVPETLAAGGEVPVALRVGEHSRPSGVTVAVR